MRKNLSLSGVLILIMVLFISSGCRPRNEEKARKTEGTYVASSTAPKSTTAPTEEEPDEKIKRSMLGTVGFSAGYKIKMNIEFIGEKSKDSDTNTGFFELVAVKKSLEEPGAELDRVLLNDYFGGEEITLTIRKGECGCWSFCPTLGVQGFAVGIPSGDDSREYKYVLLTTNEKDKISQVSVKGYKEDGYMYNAGSKSLFRFKSNFVLENTFDKIKVPVGVEENGKFVPAEYVYNGKEFVFQKIEGDYVISKSNAPAPFTASIVQTEYKNPKNPYDDEGFSMYSSYINGRFDFVVHDKEGKETGRLNINSLLGGDDISWSEKFPMKFDDYNKDGNLEMLFGQTNFGQTNNDSNAKFKYVLISIDQNGIPYQLEIEGSEGGLIYNAGDSTRSGLLKLAEPEIGFITIYPFSGIENVFIWDKEKEKFVLEQWQGGKSPYPVIPHSAEEDSGEKIKRTLITTVVLESRNYNMNIEFLGESPGDGPDYTGFFDAVVVNKSGEEILRTSVNEYFGGKEITLNTFKKEYQSWYIGGKTSWPGIAIGIPARKNSKEYKYVLLGITKSGLYRFPVKGYKESGYLYTTDKGSIARFETEKHITKDKKETVLINVDVEENGVIVPARYINENNEYVFKKE